MVQVTAHRREELFPFSPPTIETNLLYQRRPVSGESDRFFSLHHSPATTHHPLRILLLERMLNAEPELQRVTAVDRFSDIEAQGRAFDQAEPHT